MAHSRGSDATRFGLDPKVFEVEVEKSKAIFGRGRRVAVRVRHLPSGRALEASRAGETLSKGKLDAVARALVLELARQLAAR